MDQATRRWRQRKADAVSEPVETVTVSEQVVVAADPAWVWDLAWDPATSVLVSDNVERAFTVPGTPAGGVGEQQCSLVRQPDGTLVGVIAEVTECDPGHRAVTRSLSLAVPEQTTTVVSPLDQGGCVLRLRTEITVPSSAARAVREEYQAHNLRYLTRVKELAESPARQ